MYLSCGMHYIPPSSIFLRPPNSASSSHPTPPHISTAAPACLGLAAAAASLKTTQRARTESPPCDPYVAVDRSPSRGLIEEWERKGVDRPTRGKGGSRSRGRKEGRKDGRRRGGRGRLGRDGRDEAGGGDGGGAVRVRGGEHLLQAGGVRRHGHAGPHRLPLPLRLRRPRPARILRREEEANEADVAGHLPLLHLRPMRGLAGAEPLHLRDEAHLRHLRIRHDQPHPGHHIRARRPLPLRGPRHPHRAGAGQGRRHAPRRRGRHAAHLLQGRARHALAAHPRQPRRAPPRAANCARRRRQRQPRHGVAALHGQLLLLRALAHPPGQAQPGVPVPLLHHGAHVPHERAPVLRLRAMLRPGRRPVAPRLRHPPPRRPLHRRVRVGRHARRAGMVRQAQGTALRLRVQPHDARRRRRPQHPPARRGDAPRDGPRRHAHRHGTLHRALGQTARGGRGGRGAREGQRRRGPAHRRRRAPSSSSAARTVAYDDDAVTDRPTRQGPAIDDMT